MTNTTNCNNLDANYSAGATVRARRVKVASASDNAGGAVIYLGAEDFAQIEEWTKNPRGQSKAMIEAAQLHQSLIRR